MPQRLPADQRAAPSTLMLRPVVNHVAALAEGREVGVRVGGRVMVPMGGCEDDVGPASAVEDLSAGPDSDPTPLSIAPTAGLGVPPTPVPKVVDHLPCGRPQLSHRPCAQPKRFAIDISRQSIG